MNTTQLSSNLPIKQQIHMLAQQHQITYKPTELDELAQTYSRLSDVNVQFDETELLLVELDRAGILTDRDNGLLHIQYLNERNNHAIRSL